MKKKDIISALAHIGSKGGKKSSANLTPAERTERARKAASKRWENNKAEEKK
jgi:hypothetical protein